MFVEIEIVGAEYDCCKMRTTSVRKCEFTVTKEVNIVTIFIVSGDNGLNPVWNEQTQFIVSNPDIALIRFVTQDEDVFGDPNFLGQAVYPVKSLKPGYRSVQFKNAFSDEFELSSLLIHLEIKSAKEQDEEMYSSVKQLREQLQNISSEMSNTKSNSQQLESLSERMQTTQTEIKRLTEARYTTL